MIRKILIANRGEIVNRIIRAAGSLGIVPAVIYSGSDAGLDYLDAPVEKHLLKGSSLSSTYLNGDQIIAIAKSCGADAIHPGYGFLSENAAFARQCIENQITWIGPSPAVMEKMSGKESSRQQAISAGVPVLEAISGTPSELIHLAKQFNYPLLCKAVSGGGGRGMRIIHEPSQFKIQAELASAEARLAFGDPRIFVEQYLEKAKHIEVQVIGDKHGNLVHLFERECTIQRRYQKLIEESPSPSLSEPQRSRILEDAVRLSKSAGYDSAGTLEFLLAPNGNHYFMEMNTRIQVEHPVTEMVTGIDLVAEQISVAAGNPLSRPQQEIILTGHSIECRICAEDPASGFIPHPGEISLFKSAEEDGMRIDHAVGRRFEVSPLFDSLIAKVIIHAADRGKALQKMQRALRDLTVHGVPTTRDYLQEVISHPDFTSTRFYTDFVKTHSKEILSEVEKNKPEPPAAVYEAALDILSAGIDAGIMPHPKSSPWSITGSWRILSGRILEHEGQRLRIETAHGRKKLNGHLICSIASDGAAWISMDGYAFRITESARTRKPPESDDRGERGKSLEEEVHAPLPGILSRLLVKEGDRVLKGDILAVIESMKTENQVLAVAGGKIGNIAVSEGQQVKLNELIMQIDNN